MAGLALAVGAALIAAPGVTLVEEFVRDLTGRDSDPPAASAPPGRNPYLVGGGDHALTLAWHDPGAAGGPREYLVYGSTSPNGRMSLLARGIWQQRFTHRALRAGQTWHYQVKTVDQAGRTTDIGTVVTGRTGVPTRSDVNRDGKDDVVTFTRGSAMEVYVALSDGTRLSDAGKWHSSFGKDREIALTGDFNGDDRADLVTFTRGHDAYVFAALSDGDAFIGSGDMWNGFFAWKKEIPAVGDVDGDGKDDIVTFDRANGLVWAARSTGSAFVESAIWKRSFCRGRALPLVGDFDGDGRDDIAAVDREAGGTVHVALAKGMEFTAGDAPWATGFARGAATPAVGDFDGDGRDDLAAFTGGTDADVYVALSDGTRFGPPVKWHDAFAAGDQVPGAGDFDGDGRADVIAFPRGDTGDVYVSTSQGRRFAPAMKWHDTLTEGVTWPQPSSIALLTR